MAKRFTDTDKYKKPFLRGLQGAYKLLWDYLYHDCNHAGIWIVDFEVAQIYLGNDMPVNEKDALKYFNEDEKRIVRISNNSKWFIPGFVKFQYGDLNPNNKAHNSVIKILTGFDLYKNKVLLSPLQGSKDKDKELYYGIDISSNPRKSRTNSSAAATSIKPVIINSSEPRYSGVSGVRSGREVSSTKAAPTASANQRQ